ncbi:SO_0444 family Cu/Zn efflux transporter [Planctobacterium marinum]|uniref:Permease n=1 Tax=Planctobacterium marinum TaxID=1631968 RepID=A0AA48HTE4_9ALTE|nr:hypothetical protein MACH26_10240 [Planctobacterium marinum]
MNLLINFWDLLVLSAPWLLLGYFIAGVMNVYLPKKWMESQLGKASFGHSVKAAFIGAPLPLCSCGVIPTALGLRKRGASKNATASFMVATPETGVDSVSVTYALMGPLMAIVRPIAAITSAIVAGELVRLTDKEGLPAEKPKAHSCCGHKHSNDNTEDKSWTAVLQFSFGKLLGDTATWLLVGLAFAAMVQTWVPESLFVQWGDSILTMMLMIVVSIPMYICATASTPIGAGFILAGVSPGAVLVFMLTGPATNLATLGVLGKELGRRAIVAYLTGVILTAIAMGLMLDSLLQQTGWQVNIAEQLHEHQESLLYTFSGIVLSVLMLRYYAVSIKQRLVSSRMESSSL